MLDAGYVDAFRTLQPDDGPHVADRDPHVRLDYLFVPVAVCRSRGRVRCGAPSAGRGRLDHYPVVSDITIDGGLETPRRAPSFRRSIEETQEVMRYSDRDHHQIGYR